MDTESAKKTIQLTVNSRPVTARVEPRLQLADFLREHLALTGKHSKAWLSNSEQD